MAWIRDLYKDEIRNAFLVDSTRKKIWNVQLEILAHLKEIFRRHGLHYFAVYGALLGAIRHQGFIPWDDDIDIAMLRPDYNRFLEVARTEIREPYFLQNMYSDRGIQFSKVRDGRTTAVEDPARVMHQGIFVDVYPMDAAPDGSKEMDHIYKMQKELWMAVKAPQDVRTGLSQGYDSEVGADSMVRIIGLPQAERMGIFEAFMEEQFGRSPKVGFFTDFMRVPQAVFDKAWFDGGEERPFELTAISVPAGYEGFLQVRFGDWREMRREPTLHMGTVYSADIPYTEYLAQVSSGNSE